MTGALRGRVSTLEWVSGKLDFVESTLEEGKLHRGRIGVSDEFRASICVRRKLCQRLYPVPGCRRWHTFEVV